jgi:release factor glutamine methyltransferase
MLRSVQKKIIHYTWRPLLLRYLKHDRPYSFDGLHLVIKKGVFHPGFFFSTRLLIEALQRFDIYGKSLLELGSGSGLISCWAAREGAKVLAIDVNTSAVDNTRLNIEMNSLQSAASAVVSDLFENVASQLFDVIVVNPPYYPKNPRTEAEQAWYCGEGFEYFKHFFRLLPAYLYSETIVLMSLSEDCDLKAIQTIGEEHGFRFETLVSKRTGWEKHFIFQLKKFP